MDYQLWHGDCLEEMDRIESGSMDMICADLPYGTTACKWDVVIPFEPLWKQYKRVIKKNGAVVLFGTEPFSSLLRTSNLEWFKYDWVWEKTNLTNFFHVKKQPAKKHEYILVFYKYQPIYNPQMVSGKAYIDNRKKTDRKESYYQRVTTKTRIDNSGTRYPSTVQRFSNGNNGILHPQQKPVALLSYLIKTYTNEGDTILDNTFGSCSTGEATLRTGRRFIGIEKDLNYFEIGKVRMERVDAELRGDLNHLPMFQGVAV